MVCVDVSEEVVGEAIEQGCNLIISHHPLLFHGIKQLTGATPQQRCLLEAVRHDIAIYSAHTSLDKVYQGVSGRMAQQLGLTDYHILASDNEAECTGLGVIGRLPKPLTPQQWLEHIKRVFDAEYCLYTSPTNTQISTVALCGGAGSDFVEQAVEQGADSYLTADMKYHEMQAAQGRIMAVSIDHWVSEHFTREIFCEMLNPHLPTRIAKSDRSVVRVG